MNRCGGAAGQQSIVVFFCGYAMKNMLTYLAIALVLGGAVPIFLGYFTRHERRRK